jgi:hypothetical protein
MRAGRQGRRGRLDPGDHGYRYCRGRHDQRRDRQPAGRAEGFLLQGVARTNPNGPASAGPFSFQRQLEPSDGVEATGRPPLAYARLGEAPLAAVRSPETHPLELEAGQGFVVARSVRAGGVRGRAEQIVKRARRDRSEGEQVQAGGMGP